MLIVVQPTLASSYSSFSHLLPSSSLRHPRTSFTLLFPPFPFFYLLLLPFSPSAKTLSLAALSFSSHLLVHVGQTLLLRMHLPATRYLFARALEHTPSLPSFILSLSLLSAILLASKLLPRIAFQQAPFSEEYRKIHVESIGYLVKATILCASCPFENSRRGAKEEKKKKTLK